MNNIMMNKEMTKAILDGRKVQTRRVIKEIERLDANLYYTNRGRYYENEIIEYLAKYKKDEVIWVREPARINMADSERMVMRYEYLSDRKIVTLNIPDRIIVPNSNYPKWLWNCQGIPNGCIKEMARIFLKVTDVRVERLRDISNVCIEEEGAFYQTSKTQLVLPNNERRDNLGWWIELWNSTAPKGYMWEDNPYVFVYGFKRVTNES